MAYSPECCQKRPVKLTHVRHVVALAEGGSVIESARALGVSRYALMRSVRALERELGAALFKREQQAMTLTHVGELFVRRASAAQRELDRATGEVVRDAGAPTGPVSNQGPRSPDRTFESGQAPGVGPGHRSTTTQEGGRDMARLTGRTVIVTGAARGIGAAYAVALAREGAKVAVCDILDPAATVAAAEEVGGEALGRVCDITDSAAVAAFVGATAEKFGGVDGLVNNAALFATLRTKPVEQVSSDEFDQVLRVNVRGTFEMIKAVLPAMKARGYGKIVNIASGTLFKGTPFMVPYVASKGALVGLTRSVAREVGVSGICVNCVAPGLTMSEALGDNPDYSGDLATATMKSRCIPRDQMPEDLTGIVTFLLSADSDFMTGQTVVVDGGSVMN